MVTMTRGQSLPRSALWLIAGLLTISAALFVIGVAVERSGESSGVSAVHQDAAPAKSVDGDGGEGQSTSGEGHVDTPISAQTTFVQKSHSWALTLKIPGS